MVRIGQHDFPIEKSKSKSYTGFISPILEENWRWSTIGRTRREDYTFRVEGVLRYLETRNNFKYEFGLLLLHTYLNDLGSISKPDGSNGGFFFFFVFGFLLFFCLFVDFVVFLPFVSSLNWPLWPHKM